MPSSFACAGGTAAPEGGAALAADAKSAATGDVPDSQNFLTLDDRRLHVSIVYPEGWTVQQGPAGLSIKDKNNLVRIAVASGAAPTTSRVQAELATLKRSTPSLTPSLMPRDGSKYARRPTSVGAT